MPPDKNRRVLIVDDNRAIHDDFRKILSPSTLTADALDASERALFGPSVGPAEPIHFEIESAFQGQEGYQLVKKALDQGRPYAMAFVDVRMPPGWDGVETTRKMWELDLELQVVLCTAYSDYSWGEMFEKLGHHDGLLILKKPFDTVEALQVAHALTEKWWLHKQSLQKMEELETRVAERTGELRHSNESLQKEVLEHTRAEQELQRRKAFLEAQVNSALDGILVVDGAGKKLLVNQRFVDLWKIPSHILEDEDDESRLRWCASTTRNPDQYLEKVRYLYAHPQEVSRDEIEIKDGTVFDRYSSAVVGQDGANYGRIWAFRDITERKRLEADLLQSQKLETVGKLAGGIAHEFNSLLTVILGQSELLLMDLPEDGSLAKSVNEISRAAGRAGALTRQLLAYGRKQFLQPKPLDLNSVLAGMKNVFDHIMGSEVQTSIVAAPGLWLVKADAGQIEQVIINMAMNAHDAMPKGGKLILETANVPVRQESAALHPELKSGNYVMLAIRDTGAGISEEAKPRLFEPFFTTKDVGQGTGLGLSTCYGIVKQSGGHIGVESELGRGTTFRIYLPQLPSASPA